MKIQGADPSGSTQFRKSPQNSQDSQSKPSFREKVEGVNAVDNEQRNSITEKRLKQAVDQLNSTMKNYNTELRFKLDKDSQEMQVSVINSETDEVLRKIPPDKILNIVAHIKEVLGLIVDEIV